MKHKINGVAVTTRKSFVPRSKTIITASYHSIFQGRMLYMVPNQQCQSTEGKLHVITRDPYFPWLLYPIYTIQLVDNRLYRVNKHPTVCQTGLTTGWMFVYTTGLTTVLNKQPLFVQPVVKPGLTTMLNEQHCSFNWLLNRVVQPV